MPRHFEILWLKNQHPSQKKNHKKYRIQHHDKILSLLLNYVFENY